MSSTRRAPGTSREEPPGGHAGAHRRVLRGPDAGPGLPERELARPGHEPLPRRGQGEQVQLPPVEEHVGQEVRPAVEEAPRGVLLGVRDQLEEVRPPPAALAIALHLHPEHLLAGALPEQIHAAVLEPWILLHVVDLAARHLVHEEPADQLHRPVGRVLHRLHAVRARHGLTFQRGAAAV